MELVIELGKINHRYQPDNLRPALEDASFTIDRGGWAAIIGHNGSGRSILIKIVNGLLLPELGVAKAGSQVLDKENTWTTRQMAGIVFQNPNNQFVGLTVEDDVASGLKNQGILREEMLIRVKDTLEKARMAESVTRGPTRLSGGQKRRVAIAGMAALRPDTIILDEATNMLDPEGREEVISTIRKIKEESQLTVISITHDIDEVVNANRILVMRQGGFIHEDVPKEIFSAEPELIDLGLDLPFPEKLKHTLKERGTDVPGGYTTEGKTVDWLWTSVLNK